MQDGPWYECQGPNKDEVFKLLNSHCRIKEIYIPKWRLEKIIKDEHDKYDGFGSWRGFYTFTISTLVDNSFEWYETKYKPAMKVLTTSKYLNTWVNHVLYRYSESNSNQKMGLRVHLHEENFNKTSNQSN